jgi:hypothetical protein
MKENVNSRGVFELILINMAINYLVCSQDNYQILRTYGT